MKSAELKEVIPSNPACVGHYRVFHLLGEGGMGDVYDAIDEENGSRVALKTLRGLDSDRLLLFKNEFRVAAGLSHKNLVIAPSRQNGGGR